MSKHFVINESKVEISKEDILDISNREEKVLKDAYDKNRELTKKRLNPFDVDLKHTENRIIIVIDLNYKNRHTFSDGTEIYLGRQFNNLDRKHTEPVNAWVIDGEGIPKGAEILIHPNAICDAHKINGYESISNEQANSVRYYSIEVTSAFLWREGTEQWQPLKGFATALRVFKPYSGLIEGILPTQIKDILYLTSGEYEGQVVGTLKSCDYEIIYMGGSGKEERVIRLRHYEGFDHDREEITVLRHDLTEQLKEGKLLIGLSPNDCKKINE